MNSDGTVCFAAIARWRRWLTYGGVAGILACGAAALFEPRAFFRPYLATYLFYLGISLGSMVLWMAHCLTGGSWGLLIRRILEAATGTLPLLAVLFLPIAGGVRYLYPWAQPDAVAASPRLQYQQFYLCPTYFWIRAVVYFTVWLTMGFLLQRWSHGEDRNPDRRLAWKMQKFSGVGAVIYGVSIHFAAVDWAMSLQPVFRSTIWGPLFASGHLLSALAFSLIILAFLIDHPPLRDVTSLSVRNDLASLLLTMLVLWAYMAWFQFMLVWIANVPADVVWYAPRTSELWKGVMWAIFVLHFVVPFFLLLMRPVKRNSTTVAWVATLILLMQLVFLCYEVLPGGSADDGTLPSAARLIEAGLVFLIPVALGCLWLARFLQQLERRPLAPPHDWNREAALHLRRLEHEERAREEGRVNG